MPPKARTALEITRPADVELEGSQNSGNILIETLGNLVGKKSFVVFELGDVDAPNEFTRPAILLAVVDEKIFKQDVALFGSLSHNQSRPECDQKGWHVSYW